MTILGLEYGAVYTVQLPWPWNPQRLKGAADAAGMPLSITCLVSRRAGWRWNQSLAARSHRWNIFIRRAEQMLPTLRAPNVVRKCP